jgi:Microtubule associated protein (MAP65/ASE1 family)
MKVSRTEEIAALMNKIEALAGLLDEDVDSLLPTSRSHAMKPTQETIASMENVLKDLEGSYESLKVKIDDSCKEAGILCEALDIPKHELHINLVNVHYNKRFANQLVKEIERLQRLKLSRMPEIIFTLQAKVAALIEKCRKGESYYKSSMAYEVSPFNDRLMNGLRCELSQLNSFYQNHKLVFDLLDERYALQYQRESMRNISTQDRFKNRGGKLLKEEQDRKIIDKKIAIVESSLSKALDEHFKRSNTPFMVFDKPFVLNQNPAPIKKQMSSSNLRLKKPFHDRSNVQ